MEALGYAKARAAIGEPWSKLAAEATRELGFDATDPLQIAKTFGLDAAHPVGLVLLSLSDLRVGFFAKVADVKAFEAGLQLLIAHGPGQLPKATEGDATTWIDPRGEVAFVLRGDQAWMILQDRRRVAGLHAEVRRLLDGKAGTLADQADFKQAAEDLQAGGDLAGYLNMSAVVAAAVAEITGSARVQRLRDEVAHLEATGEDPEALTFARERLQRREGDSLSRAAQSAAITMAIQSFAGGLSAVRGGVDLRDGAVDLELGLRASETSLPQRMLGKAQGAGWQALGASEAPVYAATAHVDLKGIDGLVRQIATLAGGSRDIQRFEEEVRRETGLDWQQDILAVLDGRAEFVMRSTHPKALKAVRDFEGFFKGGLALGVQDEAKARSALERLLARAPKPEWARADAQGRYTLPLDPQFTLTLEIKDGWLRASNEGPVTKTGLATLTGALAEVLGPDLSSRHLVDWPQIADLALRRDEAWRAEWRNNDLDGANTAGEERHRQASSAIARRIFALFGPVAGGLSLKDGQLVLRVRQATQGPAPDMVARLAQAAVELEAEDRRYWREYTETEVKKDESDKVEDGKGDPAAPTPVEDLEKMDDVEEAKAAPVDPPKMAAEPVEKQ
ncbi:MAG: hypothetical protein KC613_25315, partial [Myxococcales bacterium]|nr:hypothetical protein [Myxococcales bacterium]